MSLKSNLITFRSKVRRIFSHKAVATAGVLSVLALLGVGAVKLVGALSAGNTVNVTSGYTYYYGSYMTSNFTVTGVNGVSGTWQGMCLEPDARTANGYATVQNASDYYDSDTIAQIKRIMLVSTKSYDESIYNAFLSDNPSFWSNLRAYDYSLSGSTAEIAYVYGHILAGYYKSGWEGIDNSAYRAALSSASTAIKEWFIGTYGTNGSDVDFLNDYELWVAKTGSGQQLIGWINPLEKVVKTTSVKIKKQDENGDPVVGAEFRLYEKGSSSNIAEHIMLDQNGESGVFSDLALGKTYCVEETLIPDGYTLDEDGAIKCKKLGDSYADKVYTFKMTNLTDIPESPYGMIKIQKKDSETGNTPQGDAELEGAVFKVFDSNNNEVDEFTIGISSGGKYVGLSGALVGAGVYTVREVSAGTGYKVNTDFVGTCTVEANDYGKVCKFTATTNQEVFNEVIKGTLKVIKESSTGEPMPNVSFKIYLGSVSEANYVKTITTGSDGAYTGELPYGKYVLVEQSGSANAEYELSDDVNFSIAFRNNKPAEGATTTVTVVNVPKEKSQFSTKLRDASSSASSPKVTLDATGTVSLIDRVTFDDEHLPMTTRNYRFVTTLYGQANGSAEWTKIDKITSDVISGATLASDKSYEIAFNDVSISSYVGGKLAVRTVLEYQGLTSWVQVFDHNKDLTDADEMVTIKNTTYTIDTRACASGTGGNTGVECKPEVGVGNIEIADTVTIDGLISGKEYRVVGKAVCFTSGSSRGTELAVASGSKTTADVDASSASAALNFKIDSSNCHGDNKKIGIQAYLYELVDGGLGNVALASHNVNLDIANETVNVNDPRIATTATSNGSTSVELTTEATINDEIRYDGLVTGTQYCFVGTLVNGENTIVEVVGQNFTPTKTSGIEKMNFSFDSSNLAGKSLTVNEYLYQGACKTGNLIVAHENGSNQTVTVVTPGPRIGTKATDSTLKTNILEPTADQKIVDIVEYHNLEAGKSYTLITRVMVSATEAIKIGNSNTYVSTFTAESKNGRVAVEISGLDLSKYAGAKLVVFEKLYEGKDVNPDEDQPIATHEDFNDNAQTLTVKPKVGTKVAESQTGLAKAGIGNAVIIDTVKYEGLTSGKTYTAKGWLVDAKGVKIAGSDGTKTFTIGEGDTKGTSGEIKISLPLRSVGLAGQKVVAYEEVYLGSEIVAEHKDLNDEDQTLIVETPTVATSAKDKVDGDRELTPSKDSIIVDTVNYSGVVVGSKYRIRGILMDKETGKPITVVNGEKISNIEASVDFVADGTSRSQELEFKIDTTNLAGKSVVVFETLYFIEDTPEGEKETEIAKHHDIDDVAQTVVVKLVVPDTGLNTHGKDGAKKVLFGGIAAIVIAASAYAIYLSESRKKIRLS